MKDILFKESDEFKEIFLKDENYVKVGSFGCTKITISMELGNGSHVAWFVIWEGDKVVQKYNSLYTEGVVYV